jgi:hypothetical protein
MSWNDPGWGEMAVEYRREHNAPRGANGKQAPASDTAVKAGGLRRIHAQP